MSGKLTPEMIEEHKSRVADDRARLNLLKEERKGLRAKALTDFQSNLSKFYSPEEIEAIESAPANEVVSLVLAKVEPYVEEMLDTKDAEIAEFEKELNENSSNLEKISEISSFFADNPDLDEDDFNDFIENELPNKKIKEFQSLSVREGFEEALKLFNEAHGKENSKEKELPLDVDSIAGETGNITDNDSDEDDSDDSLSDIMGLNR